MGKIIWKTVQKNSDVLLADGIWEMTQKRFERYAAITHNHFDNYLISHEKKPYYIGEAKDICERLKQQFKPATSTFFKNYQKYLIKSKGAKALLIDDFVIQHMPTQIGRKEVEEFGLVNLPTIVNNFQLGKRSPSKICCHNGLWQEVQNCKLKLLEEGEKEIFKQAYQKWPDNNVNLEKENLYNFQN